RSDLDADRVEAAAMYVADWLRGFAEVPVAAVLLDERIAADAAAALPPVDPQSYVPVTNVAAHYRWEIGLRGEDTVSIGEHEGDVLGSDYWLAEDAAVPDAHGVFRLAHLPADAVPETVLARLAALDLPGA
ncbi:hypothetical protein Z051_27275, partial [Rhodococcus rhodochrous KG-21]